MIAPTQIPLRVREAEPLGPTLKRFFLEAADGGLLPTASAGSHLVVTLEGPERTWRNAYSITSTPGERRTYQVIVRRTAQSRGGSVHLHEQVRAGDVLHAAHPHNLFPLIATAKKQVLIGGGVGVTPLLAHLAALRGPGAAPFEMHQFVAAAEVPLFERLLAPFAGPQVHLHPSRTGCDIEGVLARQPLGAHVYVCGPTALMDAVTDAALRLGWPKVAAHRESFGDHRGGPSFLAVLARSNIEVQVGETQSLLEAIEAAGVDAPYLCRGGACGQCMTGVLGGEPDHRDDVLTPEEHACGDRMMTCVSRSKTPRLVLDL